MVTLPENFINFLVFLELNFLLCAESGTHGILFQAGRYFILLTGLICAIRSALNALIFAKFIPSEEL